MYRVYGDRISGNCYKITLLMSFLGVEFDWVDVNILAGDTHAPEFLAKNKNAKIPVLEIDKNLFLAESNAILNFLAEDTEFLPSSGIDRARVLQWQFFEQYSHEPYIAVARFINKYQGLPPERLEEYKAKQSGGHKALSVMDGQLASSKYFVGDFPTIADISLYAYTHVADEGGFDISNYQHILRWMRDVEGLPNYQEMKV